MRGLGISTELVAPYQNLLGPRSRQAVQVGKYHRRNNVSAHLPDCSAGKHGLQLSCGANMSPKPRTRHRHILGMARTIRCTCVPSSEYYHRILLLCVHPYAAA